MFTASIFGLSNFDVEWVDFRVLLYFVPFVVFPFDTYIYAADYKVRRIGVFIREYGGSIISNIEKDWEGFVNGHRETRAEFSSWVLSLFAIGLSGILIAFGTSLAGTEHARSAANFNFEPLFGVGWFLAWIGISLGLFATSIFFRHKLRKLLKAAESSDYLRK